MKKYLLPLACAALAPLASAQALTTTFNNNFPCAAGWSCFFDLQVTNQVDISGLAVNATTAGQSGTVDIYLTAAGGTYDGNESNASAWTLVGQGLDTTALGAGVATAVPMTSPVTIMPGTYGMAISGTLSTGCTIGTGSNEVYSNADLTLTAGSVTLSGPGEPTTITFSPRVFNGTLFYGPFASSVTVGQGCGDSPMGVSSDARPVMGTTVGVTVDNIPVNNIATGLLVGFNNGGLDPAFDLSVFGATGCMLYVNSSLTVPLIAGTESETISLPIGMGPSLVGASIHFQALTIDLFTLSAIQLSNGLVWNVNPQ